MDDLKFDIYAMVKPKTDADIGALLAEVLAELANLNGHLRKLFKPATPDN